LEAEAECGEEEEEEEEVCKYITKGSFAKKYTQFHSH
jgi:hypothetical protein